MDCWVRARDGAITKFDVPAAGAGQGTTAFAINPEGAITGAYSDSASARRAAD
jgi:hypothetical protein